MFGLFFLAPGRLLTLFILLVALALLSSACSAAPVARQPSGAAPRAAPPAAPPVSGVAPAEPAPGGAAQGGASDASTVPAATERMIIRNVSLQLVVADVDAALSEIVQATADVQGYVVTSESSESGGDRYGKATLRIPNARLDETVGRIKRVAQRVRRENVNAKDVTEEFVDQEARLRNLRATESQYLDIMRNARTIEDTLKVQQVLSQVREQIERTQGRLQFLSRSADLATVSVELATSAAAQAIEGGEWSFEGTVMSALRVLVGVALALATVVIYFVALAPLWLPLYLLFRWWRRRRARRRAAAPPAPPAPAAGTG